MPEMTRFAPWGIEAVNCTHAQPDLAELICRHRVCVGLDRVGSTNAEGFYLCEDYSSSDPASLRAAIERLVGRIEK
jgi:hypothetical protein